MELTYRLNSQEMSVAFLDSIKNLFLKQEIEISIRPLNDLDQTTILSQTTLAEEWNSIEDQRWDTIL